jgi:hypothetical protein
VDESGEALAGPATSPRATAGPRAHEQTPRAMISFLTPPKFVARFDESDELLSLLRNGYKSSV